MHPVCPLARASNRWPKPIARMRQAHKPLDRWSDIDTRNSAWRCQPRRAANAARPVAGTYGSDRKDTARTLG
eukprot:scaffold19481_cov112-Isochrysis_galbana.AAC.10